MLAVIKTGGKQYSVSVGDKIKIEKIDKEIGKTVIFNEVLLLEDDKGEVKVGEPLVKGAKVKGKVLSQGRRKKVTVLKYKAKKREHQKKGYRQPFTEVEITNITFGTAKH
jgi:large subunit ribosomal protein L21